MSLKVLIVDKESKESFIVDDILKVRGFNTRVVEFEVLKDASIFFLPDIILVNIDRITEKNTEQISIVKSCFERPPLVVIYSSSPIEIKKKIICYENGVDGYIDTIDNSSWVITYLLSLLELKQHSTKKPNSEQKFKILFETMFSGYALHEIIVDIDDKPYDYKILEVNPAYERITGMKASEVVGKTILELYPETDYNTIEKYGKVALEGAKLQFEQYSTDHNKYFDIIAFSPQKGQFSTIFNDVSDYKSALKNVQESEKELQELNATKDKFFSVVAHDLKNPFHTIIGFVDLLYSEYDTFEEDEKKRMLSQIKESTESAYNLLLNLLEWSRLQLNRISFQPEELNLNKIVDQEISFLKSQAHTKGIKIISSMELNSIAYADENMIRTVIRNLISNAIKFSNEGDEVLIESGFMSKYTEIRIIDRGIGISSTDKIKLFKTDEQYSKTGTAQEKGTGLGLLLCKEFIEKNNGKIWLDSTLGSGSTFHFILPVVLAKS